MIVTLAGRRIDAQNAATARFPLEASDDVRAHIQALLTEQMATVLVSSAACGADLLALEIAGKLGLRRRVILPFTPERFRAVCVIDRPGEWGALFDQIIADVQRSGDLVLLDEKEVEKETFLSTNRVILDEAQRLVPRSASRTDAISESKVLAVIVWDGQPGKGVDITLDFANEARARSIPVAEVFTRQVRLDPNSF